MPVNGIPLVRRVMTWLISEGVTDQVINLHHRPESIAAVVGDGSDLGARVRYSWEDPVLGSGGGPRHALPLLTDGKSGSDDAFVIVNGDTLTEMALGALTDRHQQSGALVTMALIPNPRPEFYGGVRVEGGRITGFTRAGTGDASYHFIGVQAAHAAAFSSLEDGVPAESVNSLYPRLIRESPYSVAACIVDAPFSDIGTPADYLQTSVGLAAREGDRLVSGSGLEIDPGASLTRTAVWDHVRIGANCVLKDCIVCDGVQIGEGSRYERCALVPFAGQPIHPDERREGDLIVRRY